MMDWLCKKKDEITVFPDNSIHRNGVLDYKTTVADLGIPSERVGRDEDTQIFYRPGMIIKAFCNVRQKSETALRKRDAYMRNYRRKMRQLRGSIALNS